MRVVLLVSSEVCNAYSSGFPDGSVVAWQCRRHKRRGFDPWARKIPWNRKWQPTQYSCLGNPMDRRAWWAIVHGITKSRTWLRIHTLRIHVCVCVLSHFIMNKEVSLTTRKLLFSLSGQKIVYVWNSLPHTSTTESFLSITLSHHLTCIFES